EAGGSADRVERPHRRVHPARNDRAGVIKKLRRDLGIHVLQCPSRWEWSDYRVEVLCVRRGSVRGSTADAGMTVRRPSTGRAWQTSRRSSASIAASLASIATW